MNSAYNTGIIGLALKNSFRFAAKKAKMELTLRTPYRTVVQNFDGFSRILTKSNEVKNRNRLQIFSIIQAALIIQNRSPPGVYILPPGPLKVKFTQDQKNESGDYLHLGGYMFVNPDNTCEINVIDLVDKKEVKVDKFDRSNLKDVDTIAGKYIKKLRDVSTKTFVKKATS